MSRPSKREGREVRRKQLWNFARMAVGTVLGIIGFGTLSLAFVHLSLEGMAMGLFEILAGTFVALGVMSPLRKRRTGP